MATPLTSASRLLPSFVRDTLLAVGLTVLDWTSLAARPVIMGGGRRPMPPDAGPSPRQPPPASPLSYALVAVAFLPLALHRRFPLIVLGFTTVVAAVYQELHLQPSLTFLAPLVALYTVGTLKDRRTLLVAGVLAAGVTLVVSLPTWTNATFWTDLLRIGSMFGVAAALGDATRNRRAYVAEVERRAAEAEQTREEEAARRVGEERLRIARELHDITAHSLSIIAVQSGAAARVVESDPAAARGALEAIRRTSKEALDELRAMLGVLREPGENDAPLVPAPGLANVEDLLAPLESAGFTVKMLVNADLGDVPAVVDFSAYRIVQESLTNVVRHAGVCNVELIVRRDADALVVTVNDDGATPDASPPRQGHGIAGMRERVTALGGAFEASPLPGGGFHVGARLPLSQRGRS